MCVFLIFYFIEEIILLNYNLDVIFFLVPNCPLYYVGAKLSWCQIVLCQIVRFYYVGAILSWCQMVQCQMVRCQIVRCQIILPPPTFVTAMSLSLSITPFVPCGRVENYLEGGQDLWTGMAKCSHQLRVCSCQQFGRTSAWT